MSSEGLQIKHLDHFHISGCVWQVMLRRDALDVREEDYYISLYNESQAQFTT